MMHARNVSTALIVGCLQDCVIRIEPRDLRTLLSVLEHPAAGHTKQQWRDCPKNHL